MTHSQETKRKISLSNTGKKSSQWKGDKAKYQALHTWIRTHHGKADYCVNPMCPGKSSQYQWALKKGRKYSRNIRDYQQMCRSCHRKMDITMATRGKISKGLRKFLFCTFKNCSLPHLSRGYCSHHYNVIYRKK